MQCKICQSRTEKFYEKRIRSDFYFCKECHYFFKDKNKFLNQEAEIALYNQHNNSLENSGYVTMLNDFIDKAIKPYSVKNILEFGSGPTPVLSELLKQRTYNVEIYDKYFAPEKVYEGKKYDLISSTEVIEHIEEPLAIMQFFHKHLKSGGYLSLMTQFHKDSIDEFCKWWYCLDRTHISFFKPETFKVLAKKVGFKVIDFDEKKVVVLQKV